MTAALEGREWSAARPGRTLPRGKTQYPFHRRLGGSLDRSGRAENLVPTETRPRTVQTVAQSLYRLSYPAHTYTHTYIYIYIYIYKHTQGGSNMTGTACGLFTHKSVPVIFEPPCILFFLWRCGPTQAIDLLILEVSSSHTMAHHRQ